VSQTATVNAPFAPSARVATSPSTYVTMGEFAFSNLALDPLTFVQQNIAQFLEFSNEHVKFRHRRSGNPVDQGTQVVTNLCSLARFALGAVPRAVGATLIKAQPLGTCSITAPIRPAEEIEINI
jgi:hypothetical protein